MGAHGTDLRGLLPDDQMAAVAALPHGLLALFKDPLHLHVAQQRPIALLVGLLDAPHLPELLRQLRKALLLGLLRHAVIHIRPLVVLSGGGRGQILRRGADAAEGLEPHLGVLLFVVGGGLENGCDLLIALLLGHGGKIVVLAAGLSLPGKGLPQIALGPASLQFHDKLLPAPCGSHKIFPFIIPYLSPD